MIPWHVLQTFSGWGNCCEIKWIEGILIVDIEPEMFLKDRLCMDKEKQQGHHGLGTKKTHTSKCVKMVKGRAYKTKLEESG